MANENQKQNQAPAQPDAAKTEANPSIDPAKPIITADDMRRKTEEQIAVTVASGKVMGGFKDDAGNVRQREYGEGETLSMPRGQAEQLRDGGYVTF